MCRTGLWLAPLKYITCIDNAGCWSCALADWNRTAEYISSEEESADKESRRIKFSLRHVIVMPT